MFAQLSGVSLGTRGEKSAARAVRLTDHSTLESLGKFPEICGDLHAVWNRGALSGPGCTTFHLRVYTTRGGGGGGGQAVCISVPHITDVTQYAINSV